MNDLLTILEQWRTLNLQEVMDFQKFNQFAIVHHSTTIEGSTLTETENQLLLNEGLTPKGKPLMHSLMNLDHLAALQFVMVKADEKAVISPEFIKEVNGRVMRQTGNIYETVFGSMDASKGIYRKGNVRAGNSYFAGYQKVPDLVQKLCEKLKEELGRVQNPEEKLNLSFDAHFDLVSIHPFYDGNGRTSRLLMNFIQHYYGLPMGIVFKEDKSDYFEALVKTREQEDLSVFRSFMLNQYIRFLKLEVQNFTKAQSGHDKPAGFSFVF